MTKPLPRPARILATIAVVAASASLVCLTGCGEAKSGAPATARRVLLTGFEPFGRRTINDSWETVRGLDGAEISGRSIVTARLPVVYDAIEAPLRAAIERWQPEAVISFGEGTEVIRVETVGRNGYHAKRPLDNAARPPPRESIEPGAPLRIPNGLPSERILRAWRAAAIPSRASDDAGGYLCNECLFRLMRLDGPVVASVRRRGFIHVPVTGSARPDGGTFDIEVLRRAARIAVEETLADLDAAATRDRR